MRKTIRILNIVPDIYTKGIAACVADREKLAKRLLEETDGLIQLETRCVEGGSESIENGYDADLAAPYILKRAREAQEEGFGAVVIDCFQDPGLLSVRELLQIPAFGAGNSGCYEAVKLAGEFSIIGILESYERYIKDNLRRSGIRQMLCSFPIIDVPVVDLHENEAALVEKMTEIAVKAIREDRAKALIFGCTSMSTMVEPLRKALLEKGIDVPIIEPFQAALFDAVSTVMQGLCHSKAGYCSFGPKLRKLDWKE